MNQNFHASNRKQLRINAYDYSTENVYFITICTQNRKNILGNITEKQNLPQIELNEFGKIVEQTYNTITNKYNMKSHNYIIMPNHIHAMIEIDTWAGTRPAPTLYDWVRDIKSITTLEYIKGVKEGKYSQFNKKIWQRTYYERIIRNEKEYYQVFQYIENNPYNWKIDKLFNSFGRKEKEW